MHGERRPPAIVEKQLQVGLRPLGGVLVPPQQDTADLLMPVSEHVGFDGDPITLNPLDRPAAAIDDRRDRLDRDSPPAAFGILSSTSPRNSHISTPSWPDYNGRRSEIGSRRSEVATLWHGLSTVPDPLPNGLLTPPRSLANNPVPNPTLPRTLNRLAASLRRTRPRLAWPPIKENE